jgi:hypothetical protein
LAIGAVALGFLLVFAGFSWGRRRDKVEPRRIEVGTSPGIAAAKDSVLHRCADDYTGLWEIIRIVREHSPSLPANLVRAEVVEILSELLDEDLIQAGFLTWDGFSPWQDRTSEIMSRVLANWQKLGRDPSIGEVAWFTTTPAGDSKIRD